ncbi:MAG: hypothetical protein R3E53_19570 [Myxococcota bacterium]
MPYVLERMDKLWHERVDDNSFGSGLANPPSSCHRRSGARLHLQRRDRAREPRARRHEPHHLRGRLSPCRLDLPHTKEIATGICQKAGLDDDEVYAVMRGNAIRAFSSIAGGSR